MGCIVPVYKWFTESQSEQTAFRKKLNNNMKRKRLAGGSKLTEGVRRRDRNLSDNEKTVFRAKLPSVRASTWSDR